MITALKSIKDMLTTMIDQIESIHDIQILVMLGRTDFSKYGDVTTVLSPDKELILFNYTHKAQYANRWNFFERVSRGLIVNRLTGKIIARPFDRFWNWGEGGRKASGHIVTITDKLDGSMITLFRHNDEWQCATRGSFTSEQARWATKYIHDHEQTLGLLDVPDELTLIFEAIYPQNRVVVDYGKREDLVLLAARNRITGKHVPFFPSAASEISVYTIAQRNNLTLPGIHAFNNVTELIERCGMLDASCEGYVVEFSDGQRFKFKGDQYQELHRLISGLSYKHTLEAIAASQQDLLLSKVPDHWKGIVEEWLHEIGEEHTAIVTAVTLAWMEVPRPPYPKMIDRKEFAAWVTTTYPDLAPYLFVLANAYYPRLIEGEVKTQIEQMAYRFMLKKKRSPKHSPLYDQAQDWIEVRNVDDA